MLSPTEPLTDTGAEADDELTAPRLELTTLLQAWNAGDLTALERIAELVNGELLKLARSKLAAHPNSTLTTSELVQETFHRLLGGAQVDWKNTAHFLRTIARQMRRIIIDHHRRRRVRERAHAQDEWLEAERIRLGDEAQRLDLLALDLALDELAQEDERAALIVELRFFGGFTEAQTAEIVGISVSQLKRDCDKAKRRLFDLLKPIAP